MNAPRRVECVDDSVIARAQAKTVVPLQAVVRKSFEPKPQVINLGLDARLDFGREFEKGGVKTGVANLPGRAHGRLKAGACGGEVPWPSRVRIAGWRTRIRA